MTADEPRESLLVRVARAASDLARRHGIALGAVVLGTLAFATVMTEGAFDLTTQGTHFTEFYDQLGRSILHGRFDVPPDAIGLEAFIMDGKTYGYFGPTPALLRIPLDALFPSMWGHWNQLIMLAAAAASLLSVYAIFAEIGRLVGGWTGERPREQWAAAGFILAAALGSPLFFIGRRPTLYHEAIVVGAAFALGSFALLIRYLESGRARHLVLAVLTAALADLARGSVGAGPVFALVLLAGGMFTALLLEKIPGRARDAAARVLAYLAVPRGARLRRHAILLVALLAVSGAAIAYRNVKTLGNLSGEPPLNHHIAMMKDQARIDRTQGRFVHPENLKTTLYNYFKLDGIVAHAPFPWFSPRAGTTVHVFPGTHWDNAESYVSVTAGYTFWLALSLAGLAAALRKRALPGTADDRRERLRLAIAGSTLGCLGPFMGVYISQRYLHDLFPFLIITGALGLQQLLSLQAERRWVRVALPVVVLLGIYTCITSIAVTVATGRWT
jgi:hypothetical protein